MHIKQLVYNSIVSPIEVMIGLEIGGKSFCLIHNVL